MNITPEDIIKMDIKELFNTLDVMRQMDPQIEVIYKGDLEFIEYGKYDIPILNIIEGWFNITPRSKRIDIKGHKKLDIYQFFKDRRKREALMRKIIIENLEEDEITEPR